TASEGTLKKTEPNKAEAQRGDTTLYSGLPFLDPAAWRAAFPGAKDVLARFGKTELSPADIEKGIIREQTGELARAKEQLYHALEDKTKEWESRPEKEQLDF